VPAIFEMAVRNDLESAQPGMNSRLIANNFLSRTLLLTFLVASAHNSIEFRDFRPDVPDVILSMQKRALIRRIGLFLCRGWTRHIAKRWRSSVSSGPSLSSSDDFDIVPYDDSPDSAMFTSAL
jgi:hypothetical protein